MAYLNSPKDGMNSVTRERILLRTAKVFQRKMKIWEVILQKPFLSTIILGFRVNILGIFKRRNNYQECF